MTHEPVIVSLLRELETIDPRLRIQLKQQIKAQAHKAEDEATIIAIILLLEHPNEEVRSQAASALGEIRSRVATDALIKVLKSDRSYEVRSYAAEALGKIRDKEATDPLIEILRGPVRTLGDVKLHWNVADALGFIGAPLAVEPLIAILTTDYENLESAVSDLRDAAEDALAAIGGQHTAELLIDLLFKPDLHPKKYKTTGIRKRIAGSLGKMGLKLAVQPLITLLNDPQYDAQAAAADALGNFDDPQVKEALLSVLESDDNELVDCAILSLIKLGHKF